MTDEPSQADALRSAFDLAFAAPAPVGRGDVEPLIGLSLGGAAYALRLGEVSGIHPLGDRLATPGGPPGWMGLAGQRGQLVAVYDMATLLGLPPAPAAARWLAICREEPTLALAFERLDGLLEGAPDAIAPAPWNPAATPERVAAAGTRRTLIHLPTLIANVRRGAQPPGAEETP